MFLLQIVLSFDLQHGDVVKITSVKLCVRSPAVLSVCDALSSPHFQLCVQQGQDRGRSGTVCI